MCRRKLKLLVARARPEIVTVDEGRFIGRLACLVDDGRAALLPHGRMAGTIFTGRGQSGGPPAFAQPISGRRQERWTPIPSANMVKNMKMPLVLIFAAVVIAARSDGQTNSSVNSGQTEETIVCIRHGEKPSGGLGQLTCQGLNRALALPDVLLEKYGTPRFIFAPNPGQKADGTNDYYYVRPLMTIEPTAIRCGLPINLKFGYRDIKGLEEELRKPEYQNETIFVAWEHGSLDDFAKDLLQTSAGNPAQVPPWPGGDYDTIFLFKIKRSAGQESVVFSVDHERLNNLSTNYPVIAVRK
jgi:hypothetical protein